MLDKNILLKSIIRPDEKLFFAKAFNQACLCLKNHEPRFTDFLDPYKASEILRIFSNHTHELQTLIFGGREYSERTVIGFSPLYTQLNESDFPISVIEIKYNSTFSKNLMHRDFLGSILGLGIERTKIGDIILLDGAALVFSYDDISEYICYNLNKVSNTKVTASTSDINGYEFPENNFSEKRLSVSSLRIDTVLSGVFNMPRSKISDFINGEKVFINWTVAKSQSKILKENDIITLRGAGRFKLAEIVAKSKKDKYVIRVFKY